MSLFGCGWPFRPRKPMFQQCPPHLWIITDGNVQHCAYCGLPKTNSHMKLFHSLVAMETKIFAVKDVQLRRDLQRVFDQLKFDLGFTEFGGVEEQPK